VDGDAASTDDEEWIWTGTDLVRKTPQDRDSTEG
jgi:hypothetical protein